MHVGAFEWEVCPGCSRIRLGGECCLAEVPGAWCLVPGWWGVREVQFFAGLVGGLGSQVAVKVAARPELTLGLTFGVRDVQEKASFSGGMELAGRMPAPRVRVRMVQGWGMSVVGSGGLVEV